jgi:hypothetical protein
LKHLAASVTTNAIAFTRSHMPFPDVMKANEMKWLTLEERMPDRLSTRK